MRTTELSNVWVAPTALISNGWIFTAVQVRNSQATLSTGLENSLEPLGMCCDWLRDCLSGVNWMIVALGRGRR
ncbi:hypothetical protein D3C79_1066660 [compost metagenome]